MARPIQEPTFNAGLIYFFCNNLFKFKILPLLVLKSLTLPLLRIKNEIRGMLVVRKSGIIIETRDAFNLTEKLTAEQKIHPLMQRSLPLTQLGFEMHIPPIHF